MIHIWDDYGVFKGCARSLDYSCCRAGVCRSQRKPSWDSIVDFWGLAWGTTADGRGNLAPLSKNSTLGIAVLWFTWCHAGLLSILRIKEPRGLHSLGLRDSSGTIQVCSIWSPEQESLSVQPCMDPEPSSNSKL